MHCTGGGGNALAEASRGRIKACHKQVAGLMSKGACFHAKSC